MEQDSEVTCQGWMKKKGSRVNIWGDRYFVLRGSSLYYFLKEKDLAACRVSHIRSDVSKKRNQFLFSIIWPADDDSNSTSGENLVKDEKCKEGKRRLSRSRRSADSKSVGKDGLLVGGSIAAVAVGGVVIGALTAGIGLVAGIVVVGMGAVAGGGAVVAQHAVSEKEKYLTLACDSHAEAQRWVQALECQIRKLGDSIFSLPFITGRPSYNKTGRGTEPQLARLEEVCQWIKSSIWQLSTVVQGLRVYEQINRFPSVAHSCDDNINIAVRAHAARGKVIAGTSPPCLRLHIPLLGSPSDVFMAVMRERTPTASLPGVIKSLHVLESVDNSTDVVHVTLHEIFIHPSWTTPRDFCVLRYWHQNPDGSYVICMDSTFHHDCPVLQGFVRGDLHMAYLISPPAAESTVYKDVDNDDDTLESLLTVIAQLDPKGWIWRTFGFQDQFLQQFLMHTLDIRDVIDCERFMQIQFDPSMGFALRESSASPSQVSGDASAADSCTIANTPPPGLPDGMWAEPDARSFKVRGPTYCQDKVKTASGPPLFKLYCVEMFETEGNISNIASHPKNRVYQALQREDPAWSFVINIMAIFDEDTPFARIARTFFYGNDDEFRNNRFKLIPKVIDGNIMIKMAVKDTPTLLGNKLKQTYYKGDNYFEVDVDVGSSSVARHVVGLAMGYSKAIVVDMAFCLQGNDESELPEVVMGCCTCVNVDVARVQKL